jgi:UDP-N-acetylglucosamine 4,6-dehydratase
VVQEVLSGKVVLVTGGTGSFGRGILPKLLEKGVKELRVFSRDEEKQLDIMREYTDSRLKFMLGDVRDFNRVSEACRGVDVVYHAAAQKIIDSCEANPTEALQTNMLGTLNVRRACDVWAVTTAILISTDKAVKPINFYGMTKAIAEKLWLIPFHGNARFMVVRYGNVISSRGSVIPYFKQLIVQGKPLKLTHPKMTRFLITLSQAYKLVFYVTFHGENGVTYVPDIPACQIKTLAKVIANKPNYPVEIIGIRQGEKIHECLINEYEMLKTVRKNGYFLIRPEANPFNGESLDFKEYTSDRVDILGEHEIADLLKKAGVHV